jgi:hypothetical protein
MTTFTAVDPEEIDNSREGTRGRVSYPIIKAFMETGLYCAQANLDGGRKPSMMLVVLKAYCINHDMPVKPLVRKGRLYLMRLDVDKDGKPIENWLEKAFPMETLDAEVTDGPPITDEVIKAKKV